MEASDLWKAKKVYYPPAIRETASASSEAMSALQETEAAQPEAAQLILAPDESRKEESFIGRQKHLEV